MGNEWSMGVMDVFFGGMKLLLHSVERTVIPCHELTKCQWLITYYVKVSSI